VKHALSEEYVQQCVQKAEEQRELCDLLQQHPLATASVDDMAAQVDPFAVTANTVKRLFAYTAHVRALTAVALCSSYGGELEKYEGSLKHRGQLVADLQQHVAGLEHQRSMDHTIIEQQVEQITNLQKQLDCLGADDRHLLHSESSGCHGKRYPEGSNAELEDLRGELAASQDDLQRLQQEVVTLQGQLHKAEADMKNGRSTERRLRAERDKLRAASKEQDKKIASLEQPDSSSRKRQRGGTEEQDEADKEAEAGKSGSGGDGINAEYLRAFHRAEHWRDLAKTLAYSAR
jgi:chromosome segregation ATPase